MQEKENGYLTIGEVLGAHGQTGAFRARVLTEFPERLSGGARFFIDGNPYTIESSSIIKDIAILKVQGIDSPEAVEALHHKSMEIPESERKELPAGRYYQHEIIGLEVCTTAGTCLGKVSEVLTTGSNDIYVVNTGGKEVLIPAVKDVVKSIDLAGKKITIEEIQGLLG